MAIRGRAGVFGYVCAAAVCALPALSRQALPPASRPNADGRREASAALERVRAALSPSRPIASVKSLVLETEEREEPLNPGNDARGETAPPRVNHCTYRLLVPDRYQRVLVDGPVTMTHTLDGDRFWQRRVGPEAPPEVAALLERMSTDRVEQAALKRGFQTQLTGVMLAFLARWPDSAGLACRGDRPTSFDGREVKTLVFEKEGAQRFKLLVDPASGMPRALVQVYTNPPLEAVERLFDYRETIGVKLPHRLELSLSKTRHVIVVRRAAIDVALSPGEFAERRPGR